MDISANMTRQYKAMQVGLHSLPSLLSPCVFVPLSADRGVTDLSRA